MMYYRIVADSCIQMGSSPEEVPGYNFHLPDELVDAFDSFGVCELQEGIYQMPEKPIEEVIAFLNEHGFKQL